MNADKNLKHSVQEVACPNCGAMRGSVMSEPCGLCGSQNVVVLRVQAGYLYPEEKRQVVLGTCLLVGVLGTILICFVLIILIKYFDLFF